DSSSTVQTLMQKRLVEEAGRLDLPGRPVAFRTTDAFLRTFGISSLSELPSLHSDDILPEVPANEDMPPVSEEE
ncbi:MAG: SMC-Scp complex subunit ScpB, partial [Oscillospiraceae bacterium]